LSYSDAEACGLLRILTAGSVDDGKSTLFGRLLYECDGIYDDQLVSIANASQKYMEGLDLSLVTDGLQAEREQGITIDVAYRYFCTDKRKFVIADVPGHEQYTRNMATGASTADLMVLLVDVTKGVVSQTRRHAQIGALLGIPQVIVAINKMDIVQYSSDSYYAVCGSLESLLASLGFKKSEFVPVSALCGDNVTTPSSHMSWYDGRPLLQLLEEVEISSYFEYKPLRLPVQLVIRSSNLRRYAGQIASGQLRDGQELVVCSTGALVCASEIFLGSTKLSAASAPSSISWSMANDIDLCRGDMLADAHSLPERCHRIHATIIWLSTSPLTAGRRFLLKHTTRTVCAQVRGINASIDTDTFERIHTDAIELNDIGDIEVVSQQPIYCDVYSANRVTGSFIMIDPASNDTLAAGMISRIDSTTAPSCPVTGSMGLVVWFTGLSGAGKSTIANAVYGELWSRGIRVELLDGDAIRQDLNRDLGFSEQDRTENVRRIAILASLLARNDIVALVSAISPYRAGREEARRRCSEFLEVFVNAPLNICEQRDPKGLYRKAREGSIASFTGITHPYERPISPEVECKTDEESVAQCVHKVLASLLARVPNGKE
jgi:bifunctional enzyme CysN/CysC